MLCLGMVSTNLFRLFYTGEMQNLNCRRLEMATYFLLTRGWNLQEKQSCFSTVPRTVKHKYQRMWRFYRRSRVVGGWTQTQLGNNAQLWSKFCTICIEIQTDAAPMFCGIVGCQNSTTFKLAPLGMRVAHRSGRFLFRTTMSGPAINTCSCNRI